MRAPVSIAMEGITLLLMASSVMAQQPDGRTPTVGRAGMVAAQQTRDGQAPERVANAKPANAFDPNGLRVRYLLVSLSRLKAAMHDELALTAAQAVAVDELFNKYMHALRDARAETRPYGVSPGDLTATDTLRRELTKAREDGDDDKVAELTARFNRQLRSRQQEFGVTLDQFFSRVAGELTKRQQGMFHARIKKLRIGNDRPPMPPELKKLRRALSGGLMRLDPWKRRRIQKLLDEGAVNVATAEATGGDRDAVILNVRESILAELTAKQARMFELKLRLDERASRKGRHGGLKQGPPGAQGQAPADRPNNDPPNKPNDKP